MTHRQRIGVLVRNTDVTGISGTGEVAEVAVFTDGTAVVRWRQVPGSSVRPTSEMHDDLYNVLILHGHNGQTYIRWTDGSVMRVMDELED